APNIIPSLKPKLDFNPMDDANAINKAFKEIGGDCKTVMNILTHRTSFQRQAIKAEFTKLHRKVWRSIFDIFSYSQQIKTITASYQRLNSIVFRKSLIDDVRMDTIGKFKNILLHLISNPREDFTQANATVADMRINIFGLFVDNPIRFFSTQLKNCIEKNDIFVLILIICTRCEIDLGSILQDYQLINRSSADIDVQRVFGSEYQTCVDSLHMLMGCK
ncbi:hypothetical protein MXB_3701, partial [Myxobolus squamalis]